MAALKGHWRRALGLASGFLLIVPIGALLLAPWLLRVNEPPVPAERLVVLGGGWEDRPALAAQLFHEGWAPRIIVTGAGDDRHNREILIEQGVPEAAIELESAALTTKQNAEFTIALLRAQKVRRVLLVTSWYHSRRALATFRFYGPELEFISVSTEPRATGGWAREWKAMRGVWKEYVKIFWYALRYGVWADGVEAHRLPVRLEDSQ